jgi:hypothetical protein
MCFKKCVLRLEKLPAEEKITNTDVKNLLK